MLVKIAWVDDGGFCVIVDRIPVGNTKIRHVVFYYDNTGKLKYQIDKIKTSISCNHDYFLCLGKTIIFFDSEKDDFGNHDFIITSSVQATGTENGDRRIMFRIKNKQESEKLNDEHYNFKVYKGQQNIKALLTYNNDYKEPFSEGFRFKTIDSTLNTSAEDTLSLPYTDRLCNITDVVYDDINEKIFLLCELFTPAGKKDRVFQKSFVGCYDIQTKQYREIDQIPSFKGHLIQHLIHSQPLCVHAAAGAVGKRHHAIDIGKVLQRQRIPLPREMVGDGARRRRRAVDARQNADVVARRDPAVSAPDTHESRFAQRRGRFHIGADGVIAGKVALVRSHVEVMRMHMLAGRNGLAGKTDDLVVASDGIACV